MVLTQEQLNRIDAEVYELCPIFPHEDEFCSSRKRKVSETRALLRERLIEDFKNSLLSMTKNIHGVNVEVDHPDFANAKSVNDLKKTEIFSSVAKEDQEKAYQELLSYVKKQKDHPAEES
jgi:hypothetical protein